MYNYLGLYRSRGGAMVSDPRSSSVLDRRPFSPDRYIGFSDTMDVMLHVVVRPGAPAKFWGPSTRTGGVRLSLTGA